MRWDYALSGGKVEITASVMLPQLESPLLNLPLLVEDASGRIVLGGTGGARFLAHGGEVAITWAGGSLAAITPPMTITCQHPAVRAGPIQLLRLPLYRCAGGWQQRVVFQVIR